MTTVEASVTSAAPSSTAVTAEDLLNLTFVGDPQVSPDGRRVAFVATTIDREADEYRSGIWVAPADGSGPAVRFTRGPKRDTAPRWSPDGQTLAFLSDRGDGVQLWTLAADGGEARQLTHQPGGVATPAWSPDGATLAYSARVGPPEAGAAKPKPIVITMLKHKYDGDGYRLGRWRHVFVVGADGGEERQLTSGDADHTGPIWSPDGRSIAYTENRPELGDGDNVADISIVPVAGGEARRLTASTGPIHDLAWSPDGRLIAYLGHDNPPGYDRTASTRLWTVAVEDGATVCVTRDHDLLIGSAVTSDLRAGAGPQAPHWSADSATLTFVGTERGNAHIYRCAAAGGPLTALSSGDLGVMSASISDDGAVIAYSATDSLNPGDVYAASDGQTRQLTCLNEAALAGRYLAAPERFAYAAPDGYEVEGWLLWPADAAERRARGERLPLLLEIHGGPHAMYGNAFFHEFQYLVAQGFAILYTNPRGSQGYGQEHASIVRRDWGGIDYRDLMAGVDAALARGDIDPNRLGVLGGSYGGYMTTWIVGHTERFGAAVTMRSLTNWHSFYGTSDIGSWFGESECGGSWWEQAEYYRERSPITYVEQMTTPLLILHSDNDLRCPIEQGEQLFTALKRLGRETEFVRYPGGDHNLSRTGRPSYRIDRLERIRAWLVDYLRPTGD